MVKMKFQVIRCGSGGRVRRRPCIRPVPDAIAVISRPSHMKTYSIKKEENRK